MNSKKTIAVLMAACLCLMNISCAAPDTGDNTSGQSQEPAGTRTFVDSAGREVEVPRNHHPDHSVGGYGANVLVAAGRR